jgi:hypothetical protein
VGHSHLKIPVKRLKRLSDGCLLSRVFEAVDRCFSLFFFLVLWPPRALRLRCPCSTTPATVANVRAPGAGDDGEAAVV